MPTRCTFFFGGSIVGARRTVYVEWLNHRKFMVKRVSLRTIYVGLPIENFLKTKNAGKTLVRAGSLLVM